MNGGVEPVGGLARAAQVFLARLQEATPEPKASFLARHAELREWLEPMLAEADGGDALGDGAAMGEVAGAAAPFPELGPYRVGREIGRGGMGIVYEARRTGEARAFAIKVLPGFRSLLPDRVARFAREVELTQRLQHPGVVRVLDADVTGDPYWLAMEFVVGAPLDAVLHHLAGRRPAELGAEDLAAAVAACRHVPSGVVPAPPDGFAGSYVGCVVRLVIQLAEALARLHAAQVMHRDVKPSNVLLCGNGRVVLTDLGLAREIAGASLTLTGDFAGTPNYVSPEQAMAKRVAVDHRSDLFSLGSTLYELLTLQRAFPGDVVPEVLARILAKEPVAMTRLHPGLADDLVTITTKLLEKDPDRRYRSAAAVVADLQAFLDYRPVAAQRASTLSRVVRWTRREPLRAALVAVLAVTIPALTAGAGYLLARRDEIAAGRERLREQQVTGLVDSGFLALLLEDAQGAAERFTTALGVQPGDVDASVGLTLAILRSDGPESALQRLDSQLAAALPENLVALLRYPLLQRLGRPEAAVARERLPEPRTAFEWFLQALQSRDIGAFTGVTTLEDIERAVDASDRPRLWLHLHWAMFADAAGIASSCRRCAGSLLANWPDGSHARYFAVLALRRPEPLRAAALVREALAVHPDDGILRLAEAMVGEAAGDPAATTAFERAVQAMPAGPSAHYGLGKSWFDRGEMAKALASFERARELAPRLVEAWLGCGMALRRLGRFDEARQALEHAALLHPAHADVQFQLGQVLVQGDDLTRGLVHLRKAVELNAADPNKWHHVAFALFRSGDDVGGEAALRRAVKAMPGYERAHLVLVMCLQERGSAEQLREALAAWVAALPGSVDGWLQYGQHCVAGELPAAMQDPVTAAWAARRVLALTNDESGPGWVLAAEAHAALGQSAAAVAACERALQAKVPLAPAARERCEALRARLAAAPAAAAGDGKQ